MGDSSVPRGDTLSTPCPFCVEEGGVSGPRVPACTSQGSVRREPGVLALLRRGLQQTPGHPASLGCWAWVQPTSWALVAAMLARPGFPRAPLFQTTLRARAAPRTIRGRCQATPGGQAGSADVQAPLRPQAQRAAAHREHGRRRGSREVAQRQEGHRLCRF